VNNVYISYIIHSTNLFNIILFCYRKERMQNPRHCRRHRWMVLHLRWTVSVQCW